MMLRQVLHRAFAVAWLPALCFAGGVAFGIGVVADVGWFAADAAQAQERTPIRVTRIYTGDDGKTHAEEYDVPLTAQRGATELSDPVDVTSVQFRRTSPDYFIDWHTAPRRQYVITLQGESEVEMGDGSLIRLHPGHILLAEDTTGQGHISRAVGNEDRISLFLPLADQ